jgi:hypothetical protein
VYENAVLKKEKETVKMAVYRLSHK